MNGAKEFFDPVSNTYIIVSSKGNPISLYKPNLNYINEIAKSNTKYSSTTEWFLKKKN